jgi:transcriptional regulator with XRE-family HTH domain
MKSKPVSPAISGCAAALYDGQHNADHLGERLRWIRRQYRLTLEAMARRLGITRSYLSKLETGSSDNPSQPLMSMICQTYGVSREWLVNGRGQPFEAEYLNRAAEVGKVADWRGIPPALTIEERAKELGHFIACLMMAGGHASPGFLAKTLLHLLANSLALAAVTIEAARIVAEQLEFCLRTNPTPVAPVPEPRALERVLAEGTIARNTYDHLVEEALGSVEVGWVEKRLLTNVSEYVKYYGVKREMANLLARLHSASKERGMKSALAAYLKVPLASVSQWLSGDREPGGETTLRLLHWVEQQERQPNTPGSATNTAKGKVTRQKAVYEKKPSSSRKTE